MTLAKHLPNFLTVSRMFAAVFMVLYYCFGEYMKYEILFVVFTLSSVSDFFDGYLSRKWNVISNFGKCLDPISDKLLLITALVVLVDARAINLIIACVLIGREIIISGLREFLALAHVELPVSRLAKWKTAFQLTGVAMCFFVKATFFITFTGSNIHFLPFNFMVENIEVISQIIIYLAIYTSLHTGFVYIWNSRKHLK